MTWTISPKDGRRDANQCRIQLSAHRARCIWPLFYIVAKMLQVGVSGKVQPNNKLAWKWAWRGSSSLFVTAYTAHSSTAINCLTCLVCAVVCCWTTLPSSSTVYHCVICQLLTFLPTLMTVMGVGFLPLFVYFSARNLQNQWRQYHQSWHTNVPWWVLDIGYWPQINIWGQIMKGHISSHSVGLFALVIAGFF